MALRARSVEIRHRLLQLVYKRKGNPIPAAVEEFGLSRQAVHGHLTALVEGGLLEASGRTRARHYSLVTLERHGHEYDNRGLQEDRVWSRDIAQHFSGLTNNVRGIWQYGFTEMMNNAIEHSGSSEISVTVSRTALSHSIYVRDYGVGIFRKLREALALEDDRAAFVELMKGKITTDSASHSGQGIFFTSRMFDEFFLFSRGLIFSHVDVGSQDAVVDLETQHEGTGVLITLEDETARTAKSVFDRYSSTDGDYAFVTTDFPVRRLQEAGESLTSRSQARRLMARLEKFRRIELDFRGVEEIGQAFADEIFRVFARAHPGIEIVPLRAKRRVTQMIRRAQSSE